jgi:hypothetical protein
MLTSKATRASSSLAASLKVLLLGQGLLTVNINSVDLMMLLHLMIKFTQILVRKLISSSL